MNIVINYNGEWPNLCSGKLGVIVDGRCWHFPEFCLQSGGEVTFDSDWNEYASSGEWSVSEWPEDFPDELKGVVLDKINEEISWGCCGGCV